MDMSELNAGYTDIRRSSMKLNGQYFYLSDYLNTYSHTHTHTHIGIRHNIHTNSTLDYLRKHKNSTANTHAFYMNFLWKCCLHYYKLHANISIPCENNISAAENK